jgi:formate C-acetyltransferase
MLNERTTLLREKFASAAGLPQICVEKVRWFTESYKETEGQPSIIRQARALKKLFENIPISIDDEELIVGKPTGRRGRATNINPEIRCEFILKELDTISTREADRFLISEEDKAFLKETIPYWKGKSARDIYLSSVPEHVKEYFMARPLNYLNSPAYTCVLGAYSTHAIPHFDKVIALGLSGIRKEIDDEMAKLDIKKLEDYEKYLFYEAAKISLDAVIILAKRYAELAKKMASGEANPERKAELEKIAEICSRVPENPARNFHEAIQAIWFVYVALKNEGHGPINFGRVDQYLYPLYKKDIEEGRLTKVEAKELIAQLMIKLNSHVRLRPIEFAGGQPGYQVWGGFILGGVTPKGEDAVNELSYLFLETVAEVKLAHDEEIIRVSEKNSDEWVKKAIEINIATGGKLKYAGDETVTKRLLRIGVPLERARDFGLVGCVAPSVHGCSFDLNSYGTGFMELLEFALNNGYHRFSGKKVGLETGDPRNFKSYEQVLNAFKKQVEHEIELQIIAKNIEWKVLNEHLPAPLLSVLLDDCIKRGKGVFAGGVLIATDALGLGGLADVADSLAAIKKRVFEEKKITMERLIDALDHNFEGYEDVWYLLKSAPKYGNDDDYVDLIYKELVDFFDELTVKYQPFMPANFKLVLNALASPGGEFRGRFLGPSPDGRKAGEPIADGGVCPHQGRNVMGPVATFRSVTKLDLSRYHGAVLNMRFNPNMLTNDLKMRKFIQMLRTYFESGGFHVQMNFITTDILRAAQKEPEKYRDLIVRVATWSAYFVELSKDVQNTLITRMEFQEII